jgi:hypothetical protein
VWGNQSRHQTIVHLLYLCEYLYLWHSDILSESLLALRDNNSQLQSAAPSKLPRNFHVYVSLSIAKAGVDSRWLSPALLAALGTASPNFCDVSRLMKKISSATLRSSTVAQSRVSATRENGAKPRMLTVSRTPAVDNGSIFNAGSTRRPGARINLPRLCRILASSVLSGCQQR